MPILAKRSMLAAAVLAATFLFLPGTRAEGEEEKKIGWFDTAEFSLVATDGNTESQSLGFKNTTERIWEHAKFVLKAGGIRVDSTVGARTAVEDSAGNIHVVDPETDVTAESYYLNGRYGRDITDRFFWYTGAGWERNEFAGFDNRWLVEGGVGNTWYDTDDVKFRTGYALTYTKEDTLVEDPSFDDTWVGYRVGWVYSNKLGKSTTYTNDLTFDGNLEDSPDWRADDDNGLAVAMSARLALKLGLRFTYDHAPALEEVALFDEDGNALGTTVIELDELDTIFTAGLVVNLD